MAATSQASRHTWRFFRAGGFDQVRLDTGADLLALASLDQKLWVALSCPVDGTEFDCATLALLDGDGDGHIRAPDLLATIAWLAPRLKDHDLLARGADRLPLAAIDDGTPEGRRALASARQILANLGRPDADSISVEETADEVAIFGQTRFNGDGVITARSTDVAALQAIIGEIGAAYGTTRDRSGEDGIDRTAIETFVADAQDFDAWEAAGTAVALPEPPAPEAAYAALAAVRAKIDDYFVRCQLAAYDERAATLVNASDAAIAAFAHESLAQPGESVAALPLARADAGRPLPLAAGLNPAWAMPMQDFIDAVVRPLLGTPQSLGEADWQAICARLASYAAWRDARPATPAAAMPAERRQAAQAAGDALLALVAQDLALAEESAAIDEVAKLARLVCDFAKFANNFVSFRDFYTRAGKATFQAGTLYLDGRSCELCVKVTDPARHGALATLSRIHLVYCDCRRGDDKQTIAAAFTAGDIDQLMVGRNGVFYDRQGRDWNATIVKIIDHPISLRQAFWSPYRKVARLIGEQVHKFAIAKAQATEKQMADAVAAAAAGKAEPAPKPQLPATPGAAAAAPSAFDVGKFAGIFAAIGLAVGALGTALATAFTSFIGLKWWQMPLAVVGLTLAISGPSVLLAWLKLRGRTLGPLLDANGWAVNTRARINIPFGTALTQLARLPDGAERALSDPYAEKPTPWRRYLAIGVVLGIAAFVLLRQLGSR